MGVGYSVARCEVGIRHVWPGSRMLADMRADGRPVTPPKLRRKKRQSVLPRSVSRLYYGKLCSIRNESLSFIGNCGQQG